ncbi:ABC transporter permease [Glycomyces buryatensis]|uniref:ABC transporter permease n=1 Tax=Glycomyces buryatensis TaxID=2570927 RepID=A0A4V4HSY8_9ACTN|nr:ABC transporter permease [Glycomyces buryatensis]THV43476.1 ABC transporter permease [Glycomyces buryatensis]
MTAPTAPPPQAESGDPQRPAAPGGAPERRDLARRGAPNLLRRVLNSYAFRRICQSVFVIWLVSTITFLLMQMMPGNPIEIMAGRLNSAGMSHSQALATAENLVSYDTTAPLWSQYLGFLKGLVTLDFGNSLTNPSTTVFEHVMEYLPWTLFAVGAGIVLATVIGLSVGMAIAYKRGSVFDHTMTSVGSFLTGVPNYILIAAVVVIGYTVLGILPFLDMRGRITAGVEPGFNGVFLGDALFHAILPIIAFAFTATGSFLLNMKAATTEVLTEDYVTVARARGLKSGRISRSYVGRNAMLPIIPQIGLQLGTLVGGSIVIEQVLDYPGAGQMLITAISDRDYPVVQAAVIILATSVVIASLIVDLILVKVDPRIKSENQEA